MDTKNVKLPEPTHQQIKLIIDSKESPFSSISHFLDLAARKQLKELKGGQFA